MTEPVALSGQLTEPADWVALPDLAQQLDMPITRIHQMIRDRTLLAVRRDGVLRGRVSMNRGVSAESPSVSRSRFTAAFTPCSKSTNVSSCQSR